ncbi:hypothetical protein FNV43_RR18539 [Rhamnella rubrinervis]|uniref:Large ribosomal subunit protein uL11m n=1 Tax=Rhamnella rubrinervis TaxID=2594499 RepID=A0A8K0DZK4_9ROSA|nr:hypothetical protein FNV43_RR18539 [Rhamnella rubrinervis]
MGLDSTTIRSRNQPASQPANLSAHSALVLYSFVSLSAHSTQTTMSTLKEILTRRPVSATIRLTVPAGEAKPAPPVGPALGQYRLNLMAFCKDFNARTQKYKKSTPMAVTITAFKDNTFEFTVKSPSVTWYLKKAAGIESGSGRPGHVVATTLAEARIRDRQGEAIRPLLPVHVFGVHLQIHHRYG